MVIGGYRYVISEGEFIQVTKVAMCGIFGWIGSAPADHIELAAKSSGILKHRGPDEAGFRSGSNWGMGFRRLSILDLSPTGHQPMCSDDGRYWIVFNGEIYNYLELRKDLESKGERFRGYSDTEVLLRLLILYGKDALSYVNGMFALVMIDTEARTFLAARDRLGVKPLYYLMRRGHCRFASELKALVVWPDVNRDIDPVAVTQYLSLNYLPTETCIFNGVKKLPPAHYMFGTFDEPERAQVHSYWQLEINDDSNVATINERELNELFDLLADAVKIRLRSDVPVGVFLSGGLDSGLVAALTAEAAGKVRPIALTVSFSEEEFDETTLAKATADSVGLEHRLVHLKPIQLSEIDRLAWSFDEPFGDASAIPTFALCQAAAQHATVFLSGDGGDEAFAGYNRYIQTLKYAWLVGFPSGMKRLIRASAEMLPQFSSVKYRVFKATAPQLGFAAAFDGIPDDPILRSVMHDDLRPYLEQAGAPLWDRWADEHGNQSLTARQQRLDYDLYLPDDILVKVDRASMANSIEVRSPFLDYRVVEFAARLPRNALLNIRDGKLPLRQLGKRLLPPRVQCSAKRGFDVPLKYWFRNPEGVSFLRERLLSERASARCMWNLPSVEKLIRLHQSNRGRDFSAILWRLLMLDAWARQYLDHADIPTCPVNTDKNFSAAIS